MTDQLLDEVNSFLTSVETVQNALATVYGHKRSALCQARSSELTALTEREAGLTRQLKDLLRRRSQLLQRAQQQGIKATTIEQVVDGNSICDRLGASQRQGLRSRIASVRSLADRLRHESWIHWVIAHRAHQSQSELLEWISLGGRKQPVYSDCADGGTGSGGALLDHSI